MHSHMILYFLASLFFYFSVINCVQVYKIIIWRLGMWLKFWPYNVFYTCHGPSKPLVNTLRKPRCPTHHHPIRSIAEFKGYSEGVGCRFAEFFKSVWGYTCQHEGRVIVILTCYFVFSIKKCNLIWERVRTPIQEFI